MRTSDPVREGRRENETAKAKLKPIILGLMLAVLCAVAIPNCLRPRTTAVTPRCLDNLRMIDGAKTQWALRNKKTNGAPVDVGAVNSLISRDGEAPICPAGGVYTYNPVGVAPTCSLHPAPDHSLSRDSVVPLESDGEQ
jgi:hypothetical protein